jgi:hypothetical protein
MASPQPDHLFAAGIIPDGSAIAKPLPQMGGCQPEVRRLVPALPQVTALECTTGTAATFDEARAAFEKAWRVFVAKQPLGFDLMGFTPRLRTARNLGDYLVSWVRARQVSEVPGRPAA